MIRPVLVSILYILIIPVSVLFKIFSDPLCLRESNRGWHSWPKEDKTIQEGRRPFI